LQKYKPIYDAELKEDILWRVVLMNLTWKFLNIGDKNVPNFHRISYHPMENWDHDHCEGCTAKFMENGMYDTLAEGYADAPNYKDAYCWLCDNCYRILKDVQSGKIEVHIA